MTNLGKALLAAACMAIAAPANAGSIPQPVPTGTDETRAFAGLNWTFGGTSTLEGVLGVINQETDPTGDVTGAKAAVHVDLLGRGQPTSLRLTGLRGTTDLQGELGLGYNLDGSGLFGIAGGHGNYFAFGAEIGFAGGVEGYVGVHSYGGFETSTVLPPP